MLLSDTIKTVFSSLRSQPGRSLLTTLGIIIGVGSVVLMVSIGRSFEGYILNQLDAFGGNIVDVYPRGFEQFGKDLDTLTEDDFRAVAKLNTVESVAPVIMVPKSIRAGSEEEKPMIFGTTKEIFPNYGLKIESGRLLDQSDVQSARPVVVIGSQVAIDLFGNVDPLGKSVTIGDRSLRIVGVLKTFGSLLMQDMDNTAFVPYTVAKSMTGQRHLSYINLVAVADDKLAQQDITELLRQRHRIPEGQDDDFLARSTEQATSMISAVTTGLSIFLGLIAGISLLVGGIGIMNIMLVSVTERTKEIGLRKALGATKRDILLQFLFESSVLTLFGGLIGLLGALGLGLLLTATASRFLGAFPYSVSPLGILVALLMALLTGIGFGLYPAKKAAEMDPIVAMRKE